MNQGTFLQTKLIQIQQTITQCGLSLEGILVEVGKNQCTFQIDYKDKAVRNDYQVELGLHACEFFETLENLYKEKVAEEELVCRMASTCKQGKSNK